MRRRYTEEDLRQALNAAQNGISQAKAAKLYRVPRQTLTDRLRGNTKSMSRAKEPHQRLSRDEENQVYDWALAQVELPTYGRIVEYAQDILIGRGDTLPLGKNWIYGFLRRHPAIEGIKSKKGNADSIVPKSTWSEQDVDVGGSSAVPSEETALNYHDHINSKFESFPSSTAIELEDQKRLIQGWKNSIIDGPSDALPGIRPRSANERISAKLPDSAVVMGYISFRRTGEAKLGTVRLYTRREKPDTAMSAWRGWEKKGLAIARQISVPERIQLDRRHSNLENTIFKNLTMALTELALDAEKKSRPVFWKALDITGTAEPGSNPNTEIELAESGPIVGRCWFFHPLGPILNISSALFICNQIKFVGIKETDDENMLPWTYIKGYAGRMHPIYWTRFMSSRDGEAHLQFHIRYITPESMPTAQPRATEHGEGYFIDRESVPSRGINGSGPMLSEGRVSIAVHTTTCLPNARYVIVTLADSDLFREAASPWKWDIEDLASTCGHVSGIAVFQEILCLVISLCAEEHIKSIKTILKSDEFDLKKLDAVMGTSMEISTDIENLCEDCEETTAKIYGGKMVDTSALDEGWEKVKSRQEESFQKLISAARENAFQHDKDQQQVQEVLGMLKERSTGSDSKRGRHWAQFNG